MARKKAVTRLSDLDPEMYDMADKETAEAVETLTKEPQIEPAELVEAEWFKVCMIQEMDASGAMNTVELQQEVYTKAVRTVPV